MTTMYILTSFLREYCFLINIITFLFGAIFGTGCYWKWQKNKIDHLRYELSATQVKSQLRDDILEKIRLLVDHSKRYENIRDGKENVQSSRNEMKKLHVQIELLKSDILGRESELAKLENRQMRTIDLNYIYPPRPINLRITDGICPVTPT